MIVLEQYWERVAQECYNKVRFSPTIARLKQVISEFDFLKKKH